MTFTASNFHGCCTSEVMLQRDNLYLFRIDRTEEAYILAFGIRRGNDFVSWDIFNTLFAQACPCVRIVEEGHTYSRYIQGMYWFLTKTSSLLQKQF